MVKKFFKRLFCRHKYNLTHVTIHKPTEVGWTCFSGTYNLDMTENHYECSKCGKEKIIKVK